MAAGVIQSLNKFRLSPGFRHPLLSSTACQEIALHDFSEEEEMDEEEEEEEEGGGGFGYEEMDEGREGEESESMETTDNSEDQGPRGQQETTTDDLSGAEMTTQLLQFAKRISEDIQRYFGRKNKEDGSDTCSIYEEPCFPPLSGRMLYYTDLVRISQSRKLEEEEEDDKDAEDFPATLKTPWKSLGSKAEAEKLGPLAELFEYALCRHAKLQAVSDLNKFRLERKFAHVAPMHSRKLPHSFWKEPALSPIGMLSGNPPDFSDLLANWTSETGQEELNAGREQDVSELNRKVVDNEHLGGL